MADMSDAAREAVATFKAGRVDEALPMLRQAVHDEPSFELRMYYGLALARKENWPEAERQFELAYDENSSSADAAFYQGVAIARQGRLYEAHNMFKVATAIDPNHQRAQEAVTQTAKHASQVTKEGSSAAMPAGLSDLGDLANLDAGMFGAQPSASAGRSGEADVSDALDELKQSQGGSRPAAGSGRSGAVRSGKKSGCLGGSLVALTLAVLLVSSLLSALP